MEKLKLPEILITLKKEGIDITKRTFEFYQKLRLLPKPEKRVGKGGRGLYGYYDPLVIDLLKIIKHWQDKGQTLAQISENCERKITNKYKEVLEEWGFSDYDLSEMKGLKPENRKQRDREISRDLVIETFKAMGKKDVSEEVIEGFTTMKTYAYMFESKILEELKWWYPDKAIETHALQYIRKNASDINFGLNIALIEVINMLSEEGDNKEDKTLQKVISRISKKKVFLEILECKVNARLAELINGKYLHGTKQM